MESAREHSELEHIERNQMSNFNFSHSDFLIIKQSYAFIFY